MSGTSLPCQWSKPRKRKLSPKQISNLQPMKHQYGIRRVLLLATNNFLYNLQSVKSVNPDCAVFTVFRRQIVVSCDSVISSDDHVRVHKEVQTSEFDLDEFAKHYKVENVPPRNLELLSDCPSYASDGFQEKNK